ncbi:MAG: hypothetical protein DRH43_06550 [Deltaproteobacteria bacterium]|nr:MAG: hypothetical protein DRH50_08640 [Deltaproteobacteria bacterium]RLC10325.1 MAG: hypothetical protein DRH43_06550 [Deltaproteobacteria bacterium]
MDHRDIYALRLLEEIEKDASYTQRKLASELNISLGLVNSFIKRLARKGYLKITTVPKNRLRYMLTPTGLAEKSRLTYEFIQYSFNFYKTARKKLKVLFRAMEEEGVRNVVLYGAEDLSEIAYISLQETALKMIAIVDDGRSGEKFLGQTIRDTSVLNSLNYDRIIVTSTDSKKYISEKIARLNVPETKLLWVEEIC